MASWKTKKEDKSAWAVGGMTKLGVRVGFAFLQSSPPIMIACTLSGIGMGFVITAIISLKKG
ncbi:hypothetical protein [Maribacter sp. 4G9]|uniref:hypothetical protein n=1 Tax=Maribacter sp. 4G9 TaxID=1889777 RepID=UPI000C160F01|nr:hypothetical protein [Maribacter sp. 4G9]